MPVPRRASQCYRQSADALAVSAEGRGGIARPSNKQITIDAGTAIRPPGNSGATRFLSALAGWRQT
jgi:hypothetical protein